MAERQHVKIIARMCGDYAAFHEASIYAEYDITNRKMIGEIPDEFYDEDEDDIIKGKEEELHQYMLKQKEESDGYTDYDKIDAVLIDGNYYMHIG